MACKFDASKADFDMFEQQKIEVIAFLKLHFNRLALLEILEIESLTLDFGVSSPFLDENIAIASFTLPSELLKLAGNLNIDIELSEYF